MKTKTNYFLLGLFVIGGLVAVVAGVLYFGATTFASRGLTVEAYFTESVQGLEKGAIVRFRGVRIGVVTDILLARQVYPTGKPYALVRALLDPTEVGLTEQQLRARVEERVRQGFRVRLASQGLTGALYLETDEVTDPVALRDPLDIDWTPEFPRVPSVPSRIERMGASAEDVLNSLQKVDFPGLVEDARASLQAVTAAVNALDTGGIRGQAERIATSTTETLERVRVRLDGVADRADTVIDHTAAVVAAIDPEQVRRAVDAFTALAEALPDTQRRLERALDETASVSAELRGEVRTKGRDVDLILGELRRASTHFASLAETLERYPSLLLIGNPPPRTEPGK